MQCKGLACTDAQTNASCFKSYSDDLPKFHMLTMCIKETLRMSPPVFKIRRQLSRDMTFNNRLVKAGTQVVIDIYKLHHNPTIWPEPMVRQPI